MPKNIILTGSTSGIGLELAKNLILHGNIVHIIGRNFEKYSSTIHKWCIDQGKTDFCSWTYYDFSDGSKDFSEEINELPKCSGFVNSAGLLPISPLKFQDPKDIHDTIFVNLLSPILFTRELIRLNKIEKGGSMVFLSSINGTKVGTKAHAVYSATKGGIAGFVMSLANEVSSLGIRVNSVAPGSVDSPMLDKTKNLMGQKSFDNYINQYPLGMGSPTSIVSLIDFLLNNELSSWITGQNIVVDGGFTLN